MPPLSSHRSAAVVTAFIGLFTLEVSNAFAHRAVGSTLEASVPWLTICTSLRHQLIKKGTRWLRPHPTS